MSPRAAVTALAMLAACAGRTGGPAPAAWRDATLRAVPAEAAAVVSAADLAQALQRTGLADAVASRLGGAPAAVGLDPHGPAGVAVLEPASGTVAVFATVADADAVLAAAERALGPGAERRRSGQAILVAGDRGTLVMRGPAALWVTSGARSRRDLWAVRIAGLAPAGSVDALLAAVPVELTGSWLITAQPAALLPDTPLYRELVGAGPLVLAGSVEAGGVALRGALAGNSPLLSGTAAPRLPGALNAPLLTFGLRARPETAATLLGAWLADTGASGEVRPGLVTGALEVAFTERGPVLLIGSADPEAAAALARDRVPAEVEVVPGAIAVAAMPGIAEALAANPAAVPPLDRPVSGYLAADGAVLAQLLPWPQPPADQLDYVGEEDSPDFPASAEYREVETRVLQLQERHLALRVEHERVRQQAAADLGAALGRLTAVARTEADRVAVEARLAGADPAAAVATWQRAATAQDQLVQQIERLAAEHAEARRELIRLRLRDVTREQRRREQGS